MNVVSVNDNFSVSEVHHTKTNCEDFCRVGQQINPLLTEIRLGVENFCLEIIN